MKTWLRRHPIAGFILLAYGISYLLGFPLLMASQAWAPSMSQPLRTYLPRILVVYGPAMTALLLVAWQWRWWTMREPTMDAPIRKPMT